MTDNNQTIAGSINATIFDETTGDNDKDNDDINEKDNDNFRTYV